MKQTNHSPEMRQDGKGFRYVYYFFFFFLSEFVLVIINPLI